MNDQTATSNWFRLPAFPPFVWITYIVLFAVSGLLSFIQSGAYETPQGAIFIYVFSAYLIGSQIFEWRWDRGRTALAVIPVGIDLLFRFAPPEFGDTLRSGLNDIPLIGALAQHASAVLALVFTVGIVGFLGWFVFGIFRREKVLKQLTEGANLWIALFAIALPFLLAAAIWPFLS